LHKKNKKVCILGSTGSIGRNSLEVINNLNDSGYPVEVVYLSTNSNIDVLAKQIEEHSPKGVVIFNERAYKEFKEKYDFKNVEIHSGRKSLIELSGNNDFNFLINALVGFTGLEPTIQAIRNGKSVALANKETLVVAGEFINKIAQENNIKLIPIDSEHSAILQCLAGENLQTVSKLILTASGGPFRNKSTEEFFNTTVEEALNHPVWKMGNKITIDSATMMNKGLEVIEAKWLFGIDEKKIEVLIHPQSIVHSFVEFIDGSVKAQLGIPDMKIPIQYSLTYPERISSDYPRIDFRKFNCLTFEEPDFDKFKCLKLAYQVLHNKGTYPAVMNAANEVAVELFLNGKIQFGNIPELIEGQLNCHDNRTKFEIEDIIEIDANVRKRLLGEF
jgi:1-deoxy-D-xylulose-5-phosphate reductoisomerase